MKKKVMLLSCLVGEGQSADLKDFYLVFNGKFTENSFLLTSICNFSLAIKSLTSSNDLSLSSSGFMSFLQIPLTDRTEFLLRVEINGVKSILVLFIDGEKLGMKPLTVFDELTDEMFFDIVSCFTLKRGNKYISFLLHPFREKVLQRSIGRPQNDKDFVKVAKKPRNF